MTSFFLLVCCLSVIFFLLFLWQSSQPKRRAKPSNDAFGLGDYAASNSSLQRRTFAHLERQMGDFLSSHPRAVPLLLLVGVLLLWTAAEVKAEQLSAAPAPQLTQKQVSHLIESASTPEEHRALAQYFRQEAAHRRAKEQHYRELAENYRLHPPRVEMYRNEPMWKYYSRLADEAQPLALADDRLAQFHDGLAKGFVRSK